MLLYGIDTGTSSTREKHTEKPIQGKQTTNSPLSGKGTPVSRGVVQGTVRHIKVAGEKISRGTIGIFPNASPEFTTQYPECIGMIFLAGGQTSHGAIVAREFGIPAIIDGSLQHLPDGTCIELDGMQGLWRRV